MAKKKTIFVLDAHMEFNNEENRESFMIALLNAANKYILDRREFHTKYSER